MSHDHARLNIGAAGRIVNGLVVFAAVALVFGGYFSAIGQFALIA